MSYKFRPIQKQINDFFLTSSGKLFVANCSRRSGKSFWAAVICIQMAVNSPNKKIKFASAYLKDVEEIIMPAFKFVLDDCPHDMRPTWNGTKKKYTFTNGSEIQLIGLDRNPDGPRGQACDLMILDEAAFIDRLEYLYSSVIVPMFKGRPGAKAVMISTPPRTPAHPFKMFCEKATRENAYVQFSILDDPLTTETERLEYRKECLTETDWKREYLCMFVVDETLAIIPEWKEEFETIPPPDEFHRYYHRYVSMDIGVRDKTAILFGYYNFLSATLVIEDEYVVSGDQMTTDLIARSVRQKELENFQDLKVHLRIADNNNLLLVQDLTTLHGLTFFPTNKDELNAMVNKVRLWVQGGRIKVNPRCKDLINCLRYGTWTENRKEFSRSFESGHQDSLAALIYLCRNIKTHLNPIPVNHGKDAETHFFKDGSSDSPSKQLAETLFKLKQRSNGRQNRR